MQRILIIEDDCSIAEIERDYLVAAGFSVHIENQGIAGREEARHGNYDLILLDLMLPGTDGFQICETLREELDVPILMVTAKLEETDKIRGLSLGADDYIEKPFAPKVLVARVKANLAQYARLKEGKVKDPSLLRQGEISVNLKTREVTAHGKTVELKNKEFELLAFLMKNANIVFSRETLYDRVWGLDAVGDSVTVAVHINRLREKLEKDPSNPVYIQTLRGAGYRFSSDSQEMRG